MKKTMWGYWVRCWSFPSWAAIAQEVLAVNSIGYITRAPPGGDLITVSLPAAQHDG